MAKGVFRRCSCGFRLPDGSRTCPRPGCTGTVGWAYIIEIGRPGEGRRQRRRSGFRTQAEAAEERARILVELRDGLFVPPSKLTLGPYLDRWYAGGPTKGWKPNTQRDYRVGIEHIKRRLAGVLVQELTPGMIREFYAWLLREGKRPQRKDGEPAPMAPKTVANVHICLHAALADAVTDKILRTNPATGVYKYSREAVGHELQHWTLAEMQTFLAHVEGQRDAGMYAVALATGMRRGELLGLRWRDVDGNRVNVRQQWTKAGDRGRQMVSLKTGTKAFRTIDIDRTTEAVLEEQRQMVEAEREAWGSAYDGRRGVVFPKEDGKPQDPDQATRAFERLAAKCPGVPRMVFHGMRHTHATLLLEDGVSIKAVAERLGDREDTVLRIYGDITPRGRIAAVARVDAWFDGSRKKRDRNVTEQPARRLHPAEEGANPN